MANRKISELTALTAPAAGDTFAILDVGASGVEVNKKITYANVLGKVSNKNLIINGSVIISQRYGTSNKTIGSSSTYGPDRIAAITQTGSSHTLAQTADGPSGFKYSAKVTIGTGGSPSAANKNYLYQTIEGNNVAHLGSGTSSAETVTLSFWVKSSLTGNFGAAIVSGAADHSYTFPYTISSANTWEKKTKTIALPTSGGTWATDNSGGLMVMFDLGSGSDFEGTANQWNSAFDVRASSDVKLMATNSATWYVTGIQLEVGDFPSSFEFISYGSELLRCQRYYEHSYNLGISVGSNTNVGGYHQNINSDNNGHIVFSVEYKVTKRDTPTQIFYTYGGTAGSWNFNGESVTAGVQTVNSNRSSQNNLGGYLSTGANWDPSLVYGHWTSSAEL